MAEHQDLDVYAERLFATALQEGRAGELFYHLLNGGSATVDDEGKLVVIDGAKLTQMIRGATS